MNRRVDCRRAFAACVLCAGLWTAAALVAQELALRVEQGMLLVRTASLGLLDGPTLAHLKDGRSVAVDFEVSLMRSPGGVTAAQARARFILSYDLWEEQFAVTRAGTPARSITHLSASAAETWCLQNLGIPLATLGAEAVGTAVWVRIAYRVDDNARSADHDEGAFTLQRLIDWFSQRPAATAPARTIDAGPLRIPD